MGSDRDPAALGVLANGQPVFCDPDAPGVRIIAAGDAYNRELLRALRDDVFAFEDYDAEAAARAAAHATPQLGSFIRKGHAVISYASIEEAMAARHATHQARVIAAAGLDHTPVPVPEDAARALLAAAGHTHNNITISECGDDNTLVAIGHHTPEAFMAAAHAITDTHDDPFGLLWDGIYSALYVDELDFADMADWGTDDVWHAHVAVIEHGRHDGGAGVADAAECLCINHTWAMRELPAGTDGAVEVTMYRPGVEERADWRYADVLGPYRDEDAAEEDRP